MTTAQPPLATRPERLPLESLSWEAFESFCRDFVSRSPGVRECHHYGKAGDAQHGIDLLAQLDDGSRWGLQVKRCSEFGPADVAKAVRAATHPADRYVILLSREATAGVRDAVAKHANWDIWDVRDVSQKVRELPLESARRLLDHHLGPGVRRAFLGVPAVGTFLSPEEFFGPLEDTARLFHHGWELVGRAGWVGRLNAFAGSPSKRVAVLSGRGGIGKSKLLHAFARAGGGDPGLAVRFLAEGLPVTPESFDDLPLTPYVLVVDDAHRREGDLPALLALARQRPLAVKLVLACRPLGTDGVNSHLSRAGIDESQVERLGVVGDLSRDETLALARQALGDGYAHLADRLVSATRDSPLVTVVGGRLLAGRAVDPALLAADDDFRAAVLSKFEDAIVGRVGDRVDPALCRSLLALLSAVAPVKADGEEFRAAAAAFLTCEGAALTEALGVLEEGGVLLRRGHSLRITPDVLADHLLHKACLTLQGRPTGYARRAFDHFASVSPTQVLRNLAELDWRVRRATGQESDLLAGVWDEIVGQFRSAPNSVRCQILEPLKEAAYHQPGRVLDLAQLAVRLPATTEEPESLRQFALSSHQCVLDELPELLRRVAYTLDYLPACADLLWELGRDDGRQANASPERPMRVLRGLAEYEAAKPPDFNRGIVEAVRRWLDAPGAHGHAHSPLDVLDPVFAKSGHSSFAEGQSIVFKPFAVSNDETRGVRDAALEIVRGCALSEDPRVALRAVKTLQMPFFNMTFTADELAQWEPEQLAILSLLAELRGRTTHPLVHLVISEAVDWHARYARSPEVQRQAREVARSCPDHFDVRLVRSLVARDDLHDHADADADEGGGASYHRRYERQALFRRAMAEELWTRSHDLAALAATLNATLRHLADCGRQANVSPAINWLLKSRPEQTEAFAEVILSDPGCPLAGGFGFLLALARWRSAAHAVALAGRALATGSPTLADGVANFYCWSVDWAEETSRGDAAVVMSLLSHADPGILKMAVCSLRRMGRVRPQEAVAIARSVEPGVSGDLADAVAGVFDDESGIPRSALSDDDIDAILGRFAGVNRLGHHVTEFLAFAAKRLPRRVVGLLLARAERVGREYDYDFEPMPYQGLCHPLAGLADSKDYEEIVREVRDRSVAAPYRGSFWFPILFAAVSLRFGPASLRALAEWIDSGDVDKIAAATALLEEAPPAFVFEHQDFVTDALAKAHAAGEDCLARTRWNLRRCAMGHGRHKAGAGPFPQDVTLRDRAEAACGSLRRGTPEFSFYESLLNEAAANIRDTQAKDDETLD